ncbi:putative RNA methyltransferase [Enorma burkinafasonensis]|uniref:putative RNA methyltransferase n=1 Tax=Enorma burkinafasonensis TaxID=2590867 RepID=UPI0026EC6A35|nr:methyltransferase domain-containing protein [Enorma burkinafasonensis]MCI7730366.1 methyltransferase domain-containing protein [Enorma burkinafasonensis]
MDQRKLMRFVQGAELLACPVCGEALSVAGTALRCSAGHSFDIARQGYVNLLTDSHRNQSYDRASFEKRREVFASGIYDGIADALCEIVGEHAAGKEFAADGERADANGCLRVLDAGCGEGYFARAVAARTAAQVAAFDISKDSVQLAAGADAADGIAWFVADLAAIPVRDHAIDCVLDVFSPAHYGEFRRVLAPEGIVVKVVPTENHLRELRERAAGQLAHDEYSNERVIEHFEESCELVSTRRVSRTQELSPEALEALVAMTPLLFHVDRAAIDWTDVREITVEADILIGRFLQG